MPALVIVGFLGDGDAILQASSNGFAVYPLETLNSEVLNCLLALSGPATLAFGQVARHHADMARRLVARRMELEDLSSREAEVVHLLRQGMRNSDIATIMHIQPKTVKNHLRECGETSWKEARGVAGSRVEEEGGRLRTRAWAYQRIERSK